MMIGISTRTADKLMIVRREVSMAGGGACSQLVIRLIFVKLLVVEVGYVSYTKYKLKDKMAQQGKL